MSNIEKAVSFMIDIAKMIVMDMTKSIEQVELIMIVLH